jgi:hypothetical protein
VEVRADLEALSKQIAAEIPVQLATAKRQPVGAPGEVSYSVRRGKVRLNVEGDRLVVTVPVEVEVELCKPLGPFCPTYGKCSPRLSARASVPTLLGENYEIGRSEVGISLVRSCTIAGIDASSEIRRYAHRELGQVKRRIDRALPRIRPSVEGVWELLHHPVALGGSTCLRIAPDRLLQAPPAVTGSMLTARLAAVGKLGVEAPCASPDAPVKPAALPRLTTERELEPGVALQVPVYMAWSDVSAALLRSVRTKDDAALGLVEIEARAAERDGKARVALHASVAGETCGDAWFLADPWYDPTTSRVRLRDVSALSPSPFTDALARRISVAAAIALPVDVSAAPNALEAVLLDFTQGLPKNVSAEAKLDPVSIELVVPDARGLVAVPRIQGNATLNVR